MPPRSRWAGYRLRAQDMPACDPSGSVGQDACVIISTTYFETVHLDRLGPGSGRICVSVRHTCAAEPCSNAGGTAFSVGLMFAEIHSPSERLSSLTIFMRLSVV